ncbi:dymeclin isoform X2 [Impatiens glandulifera]|uniref:dymeclin isoform X2 n=1 Tax=Impatiens glandulifera TaxID=253017 RepID=UPI001FB0AD53|nr:dymeclin isoform X2 [Impatiens glandulifera]
MGAVPSTPRATRPQDSAEYLIGTFVGEKSFPLSSSYWQKLLELPLNLEWPAHRVDQACDLLAHNNIYTRHLAKILIHLAWSLQECVSTSDAPPSTFLKAINAASLSSIFLKYMIETANSCTFEELYMSLDENEAKAGNFSQDHDIAHLVMGTVLNYIGKVDVSPNTYQLHQQLLVFLLTAFSTQLISGPSPGPMDVHPFIDAAMSQESTLVGLVVHKLLLNYIARPLLTYSSASFMIFPEGDQPGVLQRVSSAAANIMLLPLNFFSRSSSEASRSPLADISQHFLLILIHYHKCLEEEPLKDQNEEIAIPHLAHRENTYFSENPYRKALESARDVEFDRTDIEGNAHSAPLVRFPFASLYDVLGMSLADETAILLLYSFVHGNADFLEYVLVRTDIDTLLMPMLETLYNASKRTSNQIYMVLIILLILSQDSSFNASIHKLTISSVPWYKERLLHQTSLGSLMVIILIRTVKYNLSKMRDVYLHTNCLATLANMAPHVHRLSSYASQRLVSLFDMLARKYNKLSDQKIDKTPIENGELVEDNLPEDTSTELHIFTDFLRIVLEILNSILTYALPRNPEVVYAIMHRQEVFQPFKDHPRFNELLENIYNVLDFFNSRMDALTTGGEWSVETVLQVIITTTRSWRGESMRIFTQLHFTYEQESHPEEFFIPYVWQLAISNGAFSFNGSSINLFPIDVPVDEEMIYERQSSDLNRLSVSVQEEEV